MITVDCADPQALAAWWADAVGGEVSGDEEFVIVSATPVMLGFQRVPEAKLGKNRVHVDFAADDRRAAVDRLVAKGATVVAEHAMSGFAWTVLQDPEGNEFDVSDPHPDSP